MEKISDFRESLEYTEKELKEKIKSVKEQCEIDNQKLRNKSQELE